jgi:DNA (cytosine-5)-methyltransferase 1
VKQLTVGSLFSGIGGLDLGLERAGMRVIWQSEIDNYACRVLKKHWPDTPNLGNIKEVNWNNVERPDVICGGYPCQPFSLAGQRKGEEDERHLWPFVRDAISVLRPRYAILENVRGHLSLGGLSVVGDLASIGYDAEWRIVSAASVGANHRRDRIIIVAYPHDAGSRTSGFGTDRHRAQESEEGWWIAQPRLGRRGEIVAYPSSRDARKQKPHRVGTVFGSASKLGEQGGCGGTGSGWWEVEPDVGRVADGVPCRVDRLRGLGNAVVPQVAEVIGRLVVAHWAREGAD